jgi:hypothetical protein
MGALEVGDCTTCGAWCAFVDLGPTNGDFVETGTGGGHWLYEGGWFSDNTGPYNVVDITLTTGPTWTADTIRVKGIAATSEAFADGMGITVDGVDHYFTTGPGAFDITLAGPFAASTTVRIFLYCNNPTPPLSTIQAIWFSGSSGIGPGVGVPC